MTYTIRPLSYIDYHNQYLELLQQGFAIEPKDVSVKEFTDFVGWLNKNHQIFVIEMDRIIIGSITVLIEQKIIHTMGKVAHIEDLIVHKSQRGNNIASMLLQYAKEYAKQNQCYKVTLNCDASLETFYTERNGFMKRGLQMAVYQPY